jgi:hypothetical protein
MWEGIVTVDVAPDAGPDLTATATLSGGGAPEARPGANCPPAVAACTSEPTHVGTEVSSFGVAPGTWIADFLEDDSATPVRQAGAHPDRAVFSFDFNSAPVGRNDDYGDPVYGAVGNVRDVTVELPPGFVGNPSAVGECTPVQLTAENCPPSRVVGRADATTFPPLTSITRFNLSSSVYNMAHPLGVITDLAFLLHGIPVHVKASLDPANHYAIRTTTSNINETLQPFSTNVTIWGVPGAPSHDTERCGDHGALCDQRHDSTVPHGAQPVRGQQPDDLLSLRHLAGSRRLRPRRLLRHAVSADRVRQTAF